MSKYNTIRPFWWFLNPWLYAIRRDRAYEDALDIIHEQGKEIEEWNTALTILKENLQYGNNSGDETRSADGNTKITS